MVRRSIGLVREMLKDLYRGGDKMKLKTGLTNWKDSR